jgi:LacI family transcriptional regulator, galactose operon repressor
MPIIARQTPRNRRCMTRQRAGHDRRKDRSRSPGNAGHDAGITGHDNPESLVTLSRNTHHPQLKLIDASGGHGLDLPTEERVRSVLNDDTAIAAVYSMGGGNVSILRALEAQQQAPVRFIGHDLDRDNVQLLRAGKVHAILHHDLRQDMRSACQHIMHYHKLLPASAVSQSSSVVVVTPENIPDHIASRFRA